MTYERISRYMLIIIIIGSTVMRNLLILKRTLSASMSECSEGFFRNILFTNICRMIFNYICISIFAINPIFIVSIYFIFFKLRHFSRLLISIINVSINIIYYIK